MLTRISYHKDPLSTNDVERVLDSWRGQKERRIFIKVIIKVIMVIYKSKISSFHCNSFNKFAFC